VFTGRERHNGHSHRLNRSGRTRSVKTDGNRRLYGGDHQYVNDKAAGRSGCYRVRKKTGRVLTVEEHSIYGGLGCAVSECLLKAGVPLKDFDIMGFNDVFCTEYGWHRDLKRAYGLSPEHIFERCKKLLQ
jgi:transketolase C-terminal domain/subunit